MKIDPTQAGKVQPDRSRRSAEPIPAGQTRPNQTGATPGTPGTDKVELSSEARALLEQMGVPSGTLSELPPERVRQIFDRVAQGFYDRQEVKDEVMQRLMARLDTDAPE